MAELRDPYEDIMNVYAPVDNTYVQDARTRERIKQTTKPKNRTSIDDARKDSELITKEFEDPITQGVVNLINSANNVTTMFDPISLAEEGAARVDQYIGTDNELQNTVKMAGLMVPIYMMPDHALDMGKQLLRGKKSFNQYRTDLDKFPPLKDSRDYAHSLVPEVENNPAAMEFLKHSIKQENGRPIVTGYASSGLDVEGKPFRIFKSNKGLDRGWNGRGQYLTTGPSELEYYFGIHDNLPGVNNPAYIKPTVADIRNPMYVNGAGMGRLFGDLNQAWEHRYNLLKNNVIVDPTERALAKAQMDQLSDVMDDLYKRHDEFLDIYGHDATIFPKISTNSEKVRSRVDEVAVHKPHGKVKWLHNKTFDPMSADMSKIIPLIMGIGLAKDKLNNSMDTGDNRY